MHVDGGIFLVPLIAVGQADTQIDNLYIHICINISQTALEHLRSFIPGTEVCRLVEGVQVELITTLVHNLLSGSDYVIRRRRSATLCACICKHARQDYACITHSILQYSTVQRLIVRIDRS